MFEPSIINQILACENLNTIELSYQAGGIHKVRQTIVTLSMGRSDPDSEVFLIVLKSFTPKLSHLQEREDALINVAHDLKNPLGAIFGYADTLHDTPSGAGMSEKQLDIVTRIRSTASRSLELVKNFQQISQLPHIQDSDNGQSCDLNEIVNNVIHYTWREDPNYPKVEVKLHPATMMVSIGRIQLESVISNLYSNALKFTARDGNIELVTSLGNRSCILEISNSGAYIPLAERKEIFEKHRRGSTSKGVSGSGLGLYIVRQIINFYKGEISVESSEETGTKFTIKLPAAEMSRNEVEQDLPKRTTN